MDTTPLVRALSALLIVTLPSVAAAQTGSESNAGDDPAAADSETDDSSSADSADSDDSDDDSPSDGDSDSADAATDQSDEESDDASNASDDQSSDAAADDSAEADASDESSDGEDGAEQEEANEDEAETETADASDEKSSDEGDTGAEASDSDDAETTEETADREEASEGEASDAEAETEPPPEPPKGKTQEASKDEQTSDDSPISDLADATDEKEYQPVEDIEEASLQEVTPAEAYPYVEWEGLFRVRSELAVNFDLDTGGTSAVLPPLGTYRPSGNPADTDNEALWSTDTELRLDPTIHIDEMLRVHTEAVLLDNLALGSLNDRRLTQPGRRPNRRGRIGQAGVDPSQTVFDASQLSPREREWYENALLVNELYGEVDTIVGRIRAGRMDDHWGLGMYANDGDCADCDYGDHVDRFEFRTKPLDLAYVTAAYDFVDQGLTNQSPRKTEGQPKNRSTLDDAHQLTFSIFRSPQTESEKRSQRKRLESEGLPAFEGGARFTYRDQNGVFAPPENNRSGASGGGLRQGSLHYQGLDLYIPDVWGKMLYNPDPNTYVRVELEGVGVFGDVDNAEATDPADGSVSTNDVNCFDSQDRQSNLDQCTENSAGIEQFGFALESEFYLGGPVRFGLNAGYASGGDAANWGYGGSGSSQYDFFQFDPNYHVDLIMFREVVGTVTNSYYANPYVQARFFESPDQRLEVQLDAIVSRASNVQGTPAGPEGGGWMGLELDGAVRYLRLDRFRAEVEGGVLFPFGAFDAELGRPRLTRPDTTFNNSAEPSVPWTVQTNLIWSF